MKQTNHTHENSKKKRKINLQELNIFSCQSVGSNSRRAPDRGQCGDIYSSERHRDGTGEGAKMAATMKSSVVSEMFLFLNKNPFSLRV